MERPRVSIGLPVYNGERFLDQAIRTLLAQTFTDIELLLADNGSTDGTQAICEYWQNADQRVRYLRSEENHGAAWNFNRLLDVARGEYFKWAADDDEHEPGFIGSCVEVLDHHPDVVLAYTQAVEIDPDSKILEYRGPVNHVDSESPSARYRAVLLKEVYCYAIFGVIRTAPLRTTALIGPFTMSDRVLLAELALHGRFVELPEAMYRHREHPGRSMYKYADDRDRLWWFDTSRKGGSSMPRWKVGLEYARSLRRAPVTGKERLASWASFAPWALDNQRVLSRELARTVLTLNGKLRLVPPSSETVPATIPSVEAPPSSHNGEATGGSGTDPDDAGATVRAGDPG
ncbi:MAG: glycosyltransferase family 2 protein [Actinomycetota bacterium]|nr:glycosyltransferase family 2 protein [Actinomycetota bacterium]